MGDWYAENIEAGVRDTVKLLRDNGFNTVVSCHHAMTVQCDMPITGEIERLHRLLYHSGERDYALTHTVQVANGWPTSSVEVSFPKREKEERR